MTDHIPDATKMVSDHLASTGKPMPKALRLADELDSGYAGYAYQVDAAAELRRLHAENETLRYELDAVPAIKEERDALQASQVAARKLLEAYAQVKASDEALMEQALNALEPPEHVRFGGTGRLKAAAIAALKERLK